MPSLSSAHEAWAEIASLAEVIEPKARSREEFIEECKSGAFDNVVAAYRTFMSVAITGIVDEELVSHLPKSLKFIAHNGMEGTRLHSLIGFSDGTRGWENTMADIVNYRSGL